MKNLLGKLSIRVKLYSSFLILASLILILGLISLVIQKSLTRNQQHTMSSIKLSDAYFEGKYFLRSEMHIFTELVGAQDKNEFNYWWGEHKFQVQFFNDQLQKIENEFSEHRNLYTDTMATSIINLNNSIRAGYNNTFLPAFSETEKLKNRQFQLLQKKSAAEADSAKQEAVQSELATINSKYNDFSKKTTRIGLDIITNLDKGKDRVRVLTLEMDKQRSQLMGRTFRLYVFFTLFGMAFAIFLTFYISKLITRPVNKILNHVNQLGKGEQPGLLEIRLEDEFGSIQHSLNNLTRSLVKTSHFSKEIGEGKFDTEFTPMSENDVLGNSLLAMRNSLSTARTEEEKRRKEDEIRAWSANGIAKFGDIIRQSGSNLNDLSYKVMSNLIDYVKANQGAMFVLNDDNEADPCFELISAIAYGRDKLINKQIRMGEGLVGRVAFEEKTIYLKDVPDNYVKITSGLGEANPKTVLIVPVKLEDKVNGIIELISFNEFTDYQIEFIEKIGETIASFITSIKVNEKTATLLADSRQKSEEMAAQEEEMRQNMEELQATQEEMLRKENNYQELIKKMQAKEEQLTKILDEISIEEEEIRNQINQIKDTD